MKVSFLSLTIISMLLLFPFVMADSDHGNFSQAKAILDEKVPYAQLTDNQFEVLGDYFMDLMAGSRHEYMDEMMGGEGSDSLREAHIRMGMNFYQEYLDTGTLQSGMMDGPMMYGSGMMGNNYNGMISNGYARNTGWFGMSLLWLLYIAIAAFVFGLIFWWTRGLVIKRK